MAYDLPRTLTLPSGLRVTVRSGTPCARPPGLFGDVLALGIVLPVAIEDLVLADFHVLRAVLAKAGRIEEAEEEISCQNCDAPLRLKPCARLETGPWEDNEANDPELDRTGPFGVPLGEIVLTPRTVRQARALWEAATPLAFDADIVRALGIVRLGEAREPAAIAAALEALGDDAFDAVVDEWLDAHYPLRLGADILCPSCHARNTIDAPAIRELDRGERRSRTEGLPALVAFVERAHEIAEPMLAPHPGVELVIEDGTPAVDDGGESLLGSYLPPPPADAAVPTRPPTITIYWRTFVAVARDEDDFDWEDELRETIAHELEHHVYFLQGHDPMDEEERAAIVRDEVRLVGRRAASQRALGMFGGSIRDFLRRAWPLILIAAIVLAVSIAESKCAE